MRWHPSAIRCLTASIFGPQRSTSYYPYFMQRCLNSQLKANCFQSVFFLLIYSTVGFQFSENSTTKLNPVIHMFVSTVYIVIKYRLLALIFAACLLLRFDVSLHQTRDIH